VDDEERGSAATVPTLAPSPSGNMAERAGCA
jgi:hypothetical protein